MLPCSKELTRIFKAIKKGVASALLQINGYQTVHYLQNSQKFSWECSTRKDISEKKKGKKIIWRYSYGITYLVLHNLKQEILQRKTAINKENNKVTRKVKKRYHCILFNWIISLKEITGSYNFEMFLGRKFKFASLNMELIGVQVVKARIHLPKHKHVVPFQVT